MLAITGLSPTPIIPINADEIWTLNNGYLLFPTASKVFIMHKQVIRGDKSIFNWKELRCFNVVLLQENLELPDAEKYPYQEIVDKFQTNYFSSTICYMIAYAIYRQYHDIKLYNLCHYPGVSNVTDDFWEKLGEEFWLGIAKGRGVKVVIDASSDYLATRTGVPYAVNG